MEQLTAVEARVLGALMEKQVTTPDAYPLTRNALVTACNQSSNRDPIVHFGPMEVEDAVMVLKEKRLARVVHPGAGERATKYRQVADELLTLTAPERAVLCVLVLRGPQTPGELRSRTERMHRFSATPEVETTLDSLTTRAEPLVARLERRPGHKEERWVALLEAGAQERAASEPALTSTSSAWGASAGGGRGAEAGSERVAALEQKVAALEARLEAVVDALGDLIEVDADQAGGDP